MTGKLFINGYDAFDTWGVVLEDGSYAKFLSGDTPKPYTENKSRSESGKQVLMKNPKLDEREFSIVFVFLPQTVSFLTRYQSFLGSLQAGKVVNNIIYPNEVYVPEIGLKYRLIYKGNSNLTQIDLSFGKVVVKFLEPNPENRVV